MLRCLTGLGVGGSNGGVIGVVKVRAGASPEFNGRELTCCASQDLPGGNPTLASSTRLSLQSFLTHFFPSIERIHCVSAAPSASSAASSSAMATEDSSSSAAGPSSEATLVVRALCEKTPKGLRWREARPRVLAERVAWEKEDAATSTEGPSDEDRPKGFEGEDLGTLVVEGVVRGGGLNANRLVHLQGFGDFRVSKVRFFVSVRSVLRLRRLARADPPRPAQPPDEAQRVRTLRDDVGRRNPFHLCALRPALAPGRRRRLARVD